MRRAFVLAGLGLAFLSACQTPPGDAPDTAPAPVAAAAPIIVFFPDFEANLDSEAAAVVDGAATMIINSRPRAVVLRGYTDKQGTREENLTLSRRRTEIVQAELARKGVPPGIVRQEAFGSDRAVSTDTLDRRVEIVLVP